MNVNLRHLTDAANRTEIGGRGAQPTLQGVDVHGLPRPALRLVSRATVPGDSAKSAPAADQRPPSGTLVSSSDHPGARIYLCDPVAHTVNVLDRHCRPLFSFGGFGAGLGQFDTPTDAVIARLETGDPDVDAELLVVADRGNHRLQVFEMDGSVIGEIGGQAGTWTPGRFPASIGAPFFRLGDVPPLPFPSRLEWRAPYLDVVCACSAIRLDLAAVLLPDFTTWIANASTTDLRLAFLLFATDPNRADIPESCLSEIASRLQPKWRRIVAWPQRPGQ